MDPSSLAQIPHPNAQKIEADGTVIENGKVVKAGPRAIVGENGEFIGLRPE